MFNVVLICIMMHHLCIHVNCEKAKKSRHRGTEEQRYRGIEAFMPFRVQRHLCPSGYRGAEGAKVYPSGYRGERLKIVSSWQFAIGRQG